MPFTLTLPDGFQYVGASLLSTSFLLLGQSTTVSKYRKLAGIPYPQLYPEKAEAAASEHAIKFNCAQRAHQNTLENIPSLYLTTILAGLKYPALATVACAFWTVSRISYTMGYVKGDPKKRVTPLYLLGTIGLLGQLLAATYVVGEFVYAGLTA